MNISFADSFNPRFPSSDYWIIQNSARAARPDLGLQQGEAARLALKEIEKLKGSGAHRLSLVPPVYSLPQLQSLFQNLDKYLFREVLKNNVSFRFSNLPQNIHGSTSALGALGNQIVISLNSDLICHPSRLMVVASLIHHMAHAYLLVCCGFGCSNTDEERHDLKHGLAYSSIVHSIQDLLVDDARIPLPDLFYCSSTISRATRLPRYRPHGMSLHSYCHFNFSDHEDSLTCDAYMHRVTSAAKDSSLKSADKESSPASSSQSIGALGSLMSSSQLQHLYRIQSKLHPSSRLLPASSAGSAGDLPTSGDYQALINLQTFFAFGDYDPKIASGLGGSNIDGPPRIHVNDEHKIKESNPTNPLHDLRTYILALRTSVEPLRRLSLVRLYSKKLLKKGINAMSFLEEIYTGAPSGDVGPGDTVKGYKPDDDLRRFAQAFLCAAHPDLPTKVPGFIQLEYEETIFGRRVTNEKDTEPVTKDNTNIHILQTTEKYKDRLAKLRGKGGLFLEDLDKVKSALDKKQPIKVPEDLLGTPVKDFMPSDRQISSLDRLLGRGAVLERLEAAEEQRRAYDFYEQSLRRRPLLGLGGIPAPLGFGRPFDEEILDPIWRA